MRDRGDMRQLTPGKFQLFSDLPDEKYAALKADIAINGVLVPIEVDQDEELLDGHHRVRAWTELMAEGLKLPKYARIRRQFDNDDDREEHAAKLNSARRDISHEDKQRNALRWREHGWTYERIADALAVGTMTVWDWCSELRNRNSEMPETITNTRGQERPAQQNKPRAVISLGDGLVTDKDAQRSERRDEATQRRIASQAPLDNICAHDDRMVLLHGDLLDAGASIPDESVDVIICDPPYGYESVPLYSRLAQLAERVLKPGATALVMTGQLTLPAVLHELSAYLRYHWTIAYLTPGESPQVFSRKVSAFWKPVLWFTKGEYAGDWHGDVIRSDDNDKRFHHWGQSESGMARLVEQFSIPGSVVLDPFVGGGTTMVVALALGRSCIGIDSDEGALNTTRRRVMEAANADGV